MLHAYAEDASLCKICGPYEDTSWALKSLAVDPRAEHLDGVVPLGSGSQETWSVRVRLDDAGVAELAKEGEDTAL